MFSISKPSRKELENNMPTAYHHKIDLNRVTPSKKTQAEKKQESLQRELSEKNARWQARQTPHSYLTMAQKKALLGVVPDKQFQQEAKAAAAGERGILPVYDAEVDWRSKDGGKVSPVKDQGTCGSCVSFGTVGMLEAMALIEKNVLLDLSEADLHFCSSHGANCNGWYPSFALQAVKSRGVCDEAHFPYASAFANGDPHCVSAPDRSSHIYRFNKSSWQVFDAYRKDYLTHHGPMVACLTVYDDFFSYGGGVYHHVTGIRAGGHCILVVGYSQSQGCWICKNSWGTGWGEAGFFKIAYGECGIDGLLSPFFGVQGVIFPA
jgi:C1A family cysteine protease